MWEAIGCCKTLVFQGLVHQPRCLEEGTGSSSSPPACFFIEDFKGPLKPLLCRDLHFHHLNMGEFLSGDTSLLARYQCISPHVLMITRTRSTLCKFLSTDLVFSITAQACLAVHDPIRAHPALTVPRGCHCSQQDMSCLAQLMDLG